MEEEEEIAPQPQTTKNSQSLSQMQIDPPPQNSPRTIQNSSSVADAYQIFPTLTSKTIPSMRRKLPLSSASTSVPPKMLKLELLASKGGKNASQNEDYSLPPLPKSLSHASLVLFRNRISDAQSLESSHSSQHPADEASEDLGKSLGLRMEEPNLVDDNLSTNEEVSSRGNVLIPIQEEGVGTSAPPNSPSIIIQPPRESTPTFSKFSSTKKFKALEDSAMMEQSFLERSQDSPTTSDPFLARVLSTPISSVSMSDYIRAASLYPLPTEFTLQFMERLSLDEVNRVGEQSTTTHKFYKSNQSNLSILNQGDATETETSKDQSAMSNLGTGRYATDLASTHPSSHLERDSRIWPLEGPTESFSPDHSTSSSPVTSDGSSDEELQSSWLRKESMTSEGPTASCSSVTKWRELRNRN